MKKFFVYMASAAFMFAACNQAEIEAPVENDNTNIEDVMPVETETITVDLNPMTKTSLDGMNTVWSNGDVVSVTVDGKNIGTLKLVEGSTFSGEVEAGHNGEATLNYPADVTSVPTTQTAVENSFANGAALLEGTTTMDALRNGEGATLQNTTALLSFSSPIAGNVAFTIGNATYTVANCEASKTYYVCVDPANSGKLSYTAGLALGAKEKASFAPEANKVYSLGALTFKESTYGVIGDNNGWAGDAVMYETSQDNFFVAYGVQFASDGGFKVRGGATWANDGANYGTTATATKAANSIVGVYTDGGSGDIKVKAGTYDIYFDRLKGQVYLMTAGKPHTEATAVTAHNDKYGVIGNFGSSNWSTDTVMNYSGDGIWTIVQDFSANNEWKVRKNLGWNGDWGYSNLYPGSDLATNSGGNIKMKNAGTYVVGFVLSKNKITLVKK